MVYCDSQYDKSYELTKELMKKYPDLKMIAGMNEYSSVGAARAVKAAKAENRIRVVGVDSSQDGRPADGTRNLPGNRCTEGI